jgi:putative sterol carrier protein
MLVADPTHAQALNSEHSDTVAHFRAPRATMSGPAKVIAMVLMGEIEGPWAFIQGKIKITGDMVFLMSLASLIV